MPGSTQTICREVVVGHNSKIWRAVAKSPGVADRFRTTISHCDLSRFDFGASDRVWVFSYSRSSEENSALLARLAEAAISEVVYVSSAATIVAEQTDCYVYPRVKRAAEMEARQQLGAFVLTLGIVYSRLEELPAGVNAATSYAELAGFLLSPSWPQNGGSRMNLFRLIDRPFSGPLERALFSGYRRLISRFPHRPCLLRPLDMVLRTFGYSWYGYVHLSNRLWTTTIS
jgi:hypothetical protein